MNGRNVGANIDAALEMLLDEIEGEIAQVNSSGSAAFKSGDYDRVDRARRQVEKLRSFKEKVTALQKEWSSEAAPAGTKRRSTKKQKHARRNLGKLEPGTRTPEPAFRLPILAALVEMGGSGSVADVLERVEQSMQGLLKDVDLATLPSGPREIRWRNTAHWSRSIMIQEGLLSNDSPRGTWEITEAGERYLQRELAAGTEES